jgi:large subunit ribosomal protein L10
MPTQKKIDTVNELTQKVEKAKSIVFADYRGLKHKQLEELRKLLKKVDSELVVAKNRLMKKALGEEKTKSLAQNVLEDTTIALFAYADEVSPLKEILKYFKTAGVGKAKAGFLGSTALTVEEVSRLSTLPSREMLLTRLVGQLNNPIQGLHYSLQWNLNRLAWALNAIKEKKN